MSQLWQDSTLLWSLMGDTVRGGWEKDFLNFSGENASLCDLPLWIFRPFTVLKLELHWSHWKVSHCFWLDSKPVNTEDAEVDFLARNSSLRFAFLFRVDGLFLFWILVGRVVLPSLVSKEKVKVEPGNDTPDQTRPSQIAKYICLKLQNVFVSNCKMYLSQIAKCNCLKLKNVFVSNCKMYLSQISNCIF